MTKKQTLVKKSSNNTLVTQSYEWYEYDLMGKVANTYHSLKNTKPSLATSTLTYSKRDEVLQNNLAGTLQKMDFTYNYRGWLTGINPIIENDVFSATYKYGTGIFPTFNGNISEIETKISTPTQTLSNIKQAYKYDGLNRLTSSKSYTPGTTTLNNQFNTYYEYDIMGNIKKLSRNSFISNAVTKIDSLTYTYDPTLKNRLLNVTDNISNLTYGGFVPYANTTANDYSYDSNGNITKDANHNITAMQYNQFNLIRKVVGLSTADSTVYTYNGLGQRLTKKNKTTLRTTYLRNMAGETISELDSLNRVMYISLKDLGRYNLSLYGNEYNS